MAALKKKLSSAPDQSIAQFYKAQGSEWVLDLEGDDAPENDNKVKEYRDNNIALAKERDTLKAQLAEANGKVAPKEEEAKTLAQKITLIEQRLADESKQRADAEARARQEQFRGTFLQATNKHKVRDDDAANVLLSMASQTYKEKEGKFVPMNPKGEVIYSKKNTDPMPLDEWLEEKKASGYRDLFLQPVGGGGRGSGNAMGGQPRLSMTRKEAMTMNESQLKAAQEGLVDITD